MEKVKSFFKKYVLVQKCDTLEAAVKQEKGRKMILLIGAAFVVLYLICCLIRPLKVVADTIMVIPVIFLVVGFITFAKANEERRRLQRVLCPKCGEKFSVEDVQSTFVKERKSSGASGNQEERNFTVVHTYQFDCTCRKCGNVSSFNWDLIAQTGKMNNRGMVLRSQDRDIQAEIADVFK